MNCPPEIASILLQIIAAGILRIRNGANDANHCSVEADHIHNLPGIIQDFSWPRLNYYWDIERASFIAYASPKWAKQGFEALWRELALAVESLGEPLSIR